MKVEIASTAFSRIITFARFQWEQKKPITDNLLMADQE